VRLEGLGRLKKSTSSGLDPATFRLVTNYATECPIPSVIEVKLSTSHINALDYSLSLNFHVRFHTDVYKPFRFLFAAIGDACQNSRECHLTPNTRICENGICKCSHLYVPSKEYNNTCLRGKVWFSLQDLRWL
jgi:hypothetical protein